MPAKKTCPGEQITFGAKVSYLPHLAKTLGHFEDAGLDVRLLNAAEIKSAATRGEHPDAQVNWLHHAVFGVANGKPLIAVMALNEAPGITIMVADRAKDEIRTAADFRGRKIAEGASHSSKGILTNYLATREGVPSGAYTPVHSALEGRQSAVLAALEQGTVDVLTFMEPMTTALLKTGLVEPIYDATTRESSLAFLPAPWSAESLLVTPTFAEQHPEQVLALVKVFLTTMRFLETSSPEEVAGLLPDSYGGESGREGVLTKIRHRWPGQVRGDYSFAPGSVDLIIEASQVAPYDDSASGQTRAQIKDIQINRDQISTNQFVAEAMNTVQ